MGRPIFSSRLHEEGKQTHPSSKRIFPSGTARSSRKSGSHRPPNLTTRSCTLRPSSHFSVPQYANDCAKLTVSSINAAASGNTATHLEPALSSHFLRSDRKSTRLNSSHIP